MTGFNVSGHSYVYLTALFYLLLIAHGISDGELLLRPMDHVLPH
jgi:hypothetical protein